MNKRYKCIIAVIVVTIMKREVKKCTQEIKKQCCNIMINNKTKQN